MGLTNSLDFHEALSHCMADNAADYSRQAVLPKLHHQAEQPLAHSVSWLPDCVGFKDCLRSPCYKLLQA